MQSPRLLQRTLSGMLLLLLWLLLTSPAQAGPARTPTAYNPVDTTDRAAVVAHHAAMYIANSPPMNWTGDRATCTPGTVDQAFLDAVLTQYNYFRRMAGVQDVAWKQADFPGTQATALLMQVNGNNDHFPNQTSHPTCWTQLSATAGNYPTANLWIDFQNDVGVKVIKEMIMDPLNYNTATGHRHNALAPSRSTSAYGAVPEIAGVPPAGEPGFAALWVFGDQTPSAPQRDSVGGYPALLWPPPGYVPHNVAFPRWSIAVAGADFSAANVSMTQIGCPANTPINTTINYNTNARFVFVPQLGTYDAVNGTGSLPAPAADTVYNVRITGATVNGQPATFEYDAVIIDPAAPAPGPNSWTGAANTNFNNCANWSANRVPRSFDNVAIAGPLASIPTVGADATVNNVTLTNGAQLVLNGGTLTVNGNWSETGGSRTTGTAGSVTFAGNGARTAAFDAASTLFNLTVGSAPGNTALTLNSNADINGHLTINRGSSLAAPHTLRVAGNWTDDNAGPGFIHANSTLIFDGATQSVQKPLASELVNDSFGRYTDGVCRPLVDGFSDEAAAGSGFFECGSLFTGLGGKAVKWNNSPDAWLFTPALALQPGVNYRLRFDYERVGSYTPYLATAANSATMLATPALATLNSTPAVQNADLPFNVPANGTYYIGIRTQGADFMLLDNIRVNGLGVMRMHNVTVASGTTTFQQSPQLSGNLQVDAAATAAFGADDPRVDGTVTNNGRLRQVKPANNAATSFLHIMNIAGTAARHYGIDLTPTSDLGNVTVAINGNQSCTAAGNQPGGSIKRCFNITPSAGTTNMPAATLRLYYALTELNGNDPNTLRVFHFENNAWQFEADGGVGLNTNGDGAWLWAQAPGIDNYSPFALDNIQPTAVGLAAQQATAPALGVWLALLALLGLSVPLRRRPRATSSPRRNVLHR